MKARYIGETDPVCLVNGKIYEVVGIEDGYYRVIDEEGIDPEDEVPGYLYAPDSFDVISGSADERHTPAARRLSNYGGDTTWKKKESSTARNTANGQNGSEGA